MMLTLTGTRIILRMTTMVIIEKDVFCLFKRVEQEKILSPHELKTYNLSYSIYKHDTVDILILAVSKTCVI